MRFPILLSLILGVIAFSFTPAYTNGIPDSLQRVLSSKTETQKMDILIDYAGSLYQKDVNVSAAMNDSLLQVTRKMGYKHGIAEALKQQGMALYFKGEYTKAAAAYVESLNISEQSGDYKTEADVSLEFANLLRRHDDLKGALSHIDRALTIYTNLHDTSGIANSHNNIGIAYETMGQLDSALVHYTKGLELYTSIQNAIGMSYSYEYVGLIHAYREQYNDAISAMKKSLEIRQKLGDKQAIAISLENIGETCLAAHLINDAIEYFNQSLVIAKEMHFSDLESYIYKMLAGANAATGKFKPAYEYQQKYTAINDSLFNLKSSAQISELQTRYETEKKEKENALLRTTNNEKELRISRQRMQLLIMSGVLLAAILGGGLVHYSNRLKQQQALNEEIQRQETLRLKAIIDSQEAERQRIAAELHDGLGQVLSAARVNLAAAEGVHEQAHAAEALSLIDRSCRELREISHDMMPSLLVRSGLPAALQEIADRLNKTGTLHVTIDVEVGLPRLSKEQEIHLFRILQELINNTLKYAEATEFQVQLSHDETHCIVMAEDNGKGFDPGQLKTAPGNGWYNIHSRLKLIDGTVEVDSRPDAGTVVTLEVPLQKSELVA